MNKENYDKIGLIQYIYTHGNICISPTYDQTVLRPVNRNQWGIRLCDSLEFVTSEKSGKLAQNITR